MTPKTCDACGKINGKSTVKCTCGNFMLRFIGYTNVQAVADVDFQVVRPFLNRGRKKVVIKDNGAFYKVRTRFEDKVFYLNNVCVTCKRAITRCLLVNRPIKPSDGNLMPHALRTIFCSDDYQAFNIDHIIPRCNGGPNEISNYQTMCYECNTKKSLEDNEKEQAKRARKNETANIVLEAVGRQDSDLGEGNRRA